MKKFDLNIEQVLEDWRVSDALREIIANAIDEQALTGTKNTQVYKDEQDQLHIRDFGRGLKYEHLTQNENEEKLQNPNKVIGKFGVGLKDALATLDRHKVTVLIKSSHGDITIGQMPKHGFEDVVTLHAFIEAPSDPELVGTEFILRGVDDKELEIAKEYFLFFSNALCLEETTYGQVLEHLTDAASIYINGVRVAQEENFLFSYNITSLTKKMRSALNRERSNVGRTAYTDRVKTILLNCQEDSVIHRLVDDLQAFEHGKMHDELNWLDVATHACKLLNSIEKIIFLTPEELISATTMVDRARRDNYRIVTIPGNIKDKIRGQRDSLGQPIRDLRQYVAEWNKSFSYKIVELDELTESERKIFEGYQKVIDLIGGLPSCVRQILISETMRLEGYSEAAGVWEGTTGRIIIKRDQLGSLQDFAGILLHEVAHARSGASDVTRQFENELTTLLGIVTSNILAE